MAYEEMLRRFFDASKEGRSPNFDLILLGMGVDWAHASLFPGTARLHETERWVAVNRLAASAPPRLTLTPVIINTRKTHFFSCLGQKSKPFEASARRTGRRQRGYPRSLFIRRMGSCSGWWTRTRLRNSSRAMSGVDAAVERLYDG